MWYKDEQLSSAVTSCPGGLLVAPLNLLSAETRLLLIESAWTKVSRCKLIINRIFFFLFSIPLAF